MDSTTLALIDRVRPFTKCSVARLTSMVEALQYVDRKNIPGAIVECGIWRGGNIMLARKLSPARTCWLFDTFNGMPDPGPFDVNRKGVPAGPAYLGKARVSRHEVIEYLRAADCWNDERVRMVEGMVEETLDNPRNIPKAIAVLRLDTDYYESTKKELAILYPRLSPGGVLIVDDFGHWVGARKAVTEYFGKRMPKHRPVDYTAIMLIKPAQA